MTESNDSDLLSNATKSIYNYPCENDLLVQESNINNPVVLLYDRSSNGLDIVQLFLGLVFNPLALIVFNKCSFRRTSLTLILVTTAFIDMVSLSLIGILSTLLSLGKISVIDHASWLCYLMPCLTRFLLASAAFSVAILALERIVAFISRCCQNKSVFLGRRGTLIVLVVTYTMVLACHVPCLVWSRYDSNSRRCIPWKMPQAWIILMIDLFLQNILPAACSVLVIVVLLVMTLCVAYTDIKSPLDKWATTLTLCAQSLYLAASLPQLIYSGFLIYSGMVYGVQSCERDAYISKQTLSKLLTSIFNLHMTFKPVVYAVCNRYRRELLGTVCRNYIFRPKLPRDSVMVTQRQGI